MGILLASLWIFLLLFFQPLSGGTPLAAAPASPKTISLASWNIRNISTRSRSGAELGIISLIIFRHDFIALQEVLDKEVIERIQKILKKDFQVDYKRGQDRA